MMPAFQIPTSALRHITLDNITDGETVYQRCILLTGQSPSRSEEDFVSVSTSDFPRQSWPISGNRFKCLIILSPGANVVTLTSHVNGEAGEPTNLNLMYIPLLQTPPLHLAIMIAKDSPLLIDCPPHKQGAISTAHSNLEAAINKFRMTAYMWQALTAEDMRVKGLGRRSFRIEEEWTTETLSQHFIQQAYEASGNHMRSTAKIHLVRTEKTVAELRDAQVAQQNPQARRKDDLHKYFTDALKGYGGTLASSAHPIVAGLILDSTYSTEQDLILGHAALGCSNPKGISLGMIGSHLTYSWPRFMEEIPSCLLDTVVPGDTVGNDNGECGTMWEACSIGQGAFLHEVGHAFGAPHTIGIMARGYAQDWPKNFLSRTAYCAHTKAKGEHVIDGETKNEARWDLSDALSFKVLPHFHLPSDEIQSHEIRVAEPNIQIVYEDGKDEFLRLVLESQAQLARVKFGDKDEPEPSIAKPISKLQFTLNELEARFDRTKPLTLEVLGMNGKSRVIGNVWKLFSNISFIPVPGSSAVLQKRSIMSKKLESLREDRIKRDIWEWAVLLNERGVNGVTPAIKIDSRVGCILDGAVIYYKDGHKTPCGPRWEKHGGGQHSFGGHASEKIMIPDGVEVVKVQVGNNGRELDGLRFHLSNGTAGGYLYDSSTTHTLEPATSEKIIGFYGRSDWGSGFDGIQEFGIITAPRGVDLPATIYDLPELQNTDGGHGPRKEHGEDEYCSDEDQYDQEDEDEDMDEDGE